MAKHNSLKIDLTQPCLLETWHLSESELYFWLLKQTTDPEMSFDLLQDTFLKALQQKRAFCDIKNQRAWLYRVAHNLLIDKHRKANKFISLNTNINEPIWEDEDRPAVDSLSQCLPKVLNKLSSEDKKIIEQCDLQGCTQQDFAEQHGLTLVATKSRIQRARHKLKNILLKQCNIRFDEQQRVCCFYQDDSQ